MHLKTLTDKIKNKTAVVGIIGLGYVGLPLTLRFIKVGFKVIGLDIDESKIKLLNAGKSYIHHIASDRIAEAVSKGFVATTDFSKAKECDALIICVPTPLDKHREPDLSYVTDTTDALVPHMRAGQILSLESTTYPGTTDEELQPRVEKRGFKIGEDVFLVHSPEREDPGNPNFSTETIPKICGGITPACLEAGVALYSQVINKVVPVSSTRAAELTKLLENIHRVVNIGLVNEMKIVADKMDIDIHEVIKAAATKPFGFTPYFPGPGIGGHCIPVDPFYLTWKAREYGINTKFIELAGEINTNMPAWVIGKVVDALNQSGKSIKDAKILLLGVAYKKNVDDIRESPAMELLEILLHKNANVEYSDPFFPTLPQMRKHKIDRKSVTITAENVAKFDCVLVATNHDAFDYALIKKNAQLIVDTRGVYAERAPNIVKA